MQNFRHFQKSVSSKVIKQMRGRGRMGTGELRRGVWKIMDRDSLPIHSFWLPKVQVDAHPVMLIDCSTRARMSQIPSTWIQLHICFQKVLGQNATFPF